MVKTPPFNVGGVGILGTKMPWGVAKIEKKKETLSQPLGLRQRGNGAAADAASIDLGTLCPESLRILNMFTRRSLAMEPIEQLPTVHSLV